LWIYLPAHSNYFAPGPYPPSFQAYPFSDAEIYDLGAQYALIGQRLNNFGYVDKPLYTFLLFLFHSVAGQSTARVLVLQKFADRAAAGAGVPDREVASQPGGGGVGGGARDLFERQCIRCQCVHPGHAYQTLDERVADGLDAGAFYLFTGEVAEKARETI